MGEAHCPDDNQNTHPSVPHRQSQRGVPGQRRWETWHHLNSSAPQALDAVCGCSLSGLCPAGSCTSRWPGLPREVPWCPAPRCPPAAPQPGPHPHLPRRGHAAPAPGSRGAASAEGEKRARVGSARAAHPPTQPAQRETRGAPAGSYLGSGRAPSAGS